MSPAAKNVLEAALKLPVEERVELALRLEDRYDAKTISVIVASWKDEVAGLIETAKYQQGNEQTEGDVERRSSER